MINTSMSKSTIEYDSEENRAIYIGNLPLSMTEQNLAEIFAVTGSVHTVKLIGKSTLNAGNNYAFIEYDDPASAQAAIDTFNGRTICNSPVKVNWAHQSTSKASARDEMSSHYTIFVGDLVAEVDDACLWQAFSRYASLSEARIMWDMNTKRSRGYGFCSFMRREDAEMAIRQMSGAWLGSRQIRCNWANMKHTTPTPRTPIANLGFGMDTESGLPVVFQTLDQSQQYMVIANQAPYEVQTLYLGNLAEDTMPDDLQPIFAVYGGCKDVRLHTDRGFAFVTLPSHEYAALAIVQLQGCIIKGRPLKLSWQHKLESSIRNYPDPLLNQSSTLSRDSCMGAETTGRVLQHPRKLSHSMSLEPRQEFQSWNQQGTAIFGQ